MKKQELIKSLKLTRDSYSNKDRFRGGVRTGLGIALGEIEKLDEPEKVVIPQLVADWIEHCKAKDLDLYEAFGHSDMSVEVSDLVGDMDADILARAWLDGYEVEKEKLYKFSSNNQSAGFWFLSTTLDGKVNIGTNREFFEHDSKCLHITEEQIKDYDPRYWPFAVEVAE